MQKYICTAIKKDVNNPTPAGETPAVGIDVYVRDLNDNPAVIYSDNGVTLKTQPFQTDSNGKAEFYAANGRYKVIYDLPSGQQSDIDVILEDPGDRKATQEQAEDGVDNSQFITPFTAHKSFNRFGVGTLSLPVLTQDLNNGANTGFYIAGLGSTNTPAGATAEGYWSCYKYDTVNYSLQTWVDFGAVNPNFYHRTETNSVFTDWIKHLTSDNLYHAQNVSGSTVAINGTVAGASLTPAKSGSWRNVSGNDILNNYYGLFEAV